MADELCFVQFPHPGPEHEPDRADLKCWNTGDHRRKFMVNPGRYVDDVGTVYDAELSFWCEWEPPSEVVTRIAEPLALGPRYLYRPFWHQPQPGRWLQNTDPFVFGDCFRYTVCRQHHNGKPTKLQRLAPGSLILFGSALRGRFVLDTVFVVNSWVDYDHPAALARMVPPPYETITLNRLDLAQRRLYCGATYEKPYDDMFSFTPCLPSADAPRGFARPAIWLPGLVSDRLAMSFRRRVQPDVDAVKQIWDEVVRQVKEQGLTLGIAAEMPEERPKGC